MARSSFSKTDSLGNHTDGLPLPSYSLFIAKCSLLSIPTPISNPHKLDESKQQLRKATPVPCLMEWGVRANGRDGNGWREGEIQDGRGKMGGSLAHGGLNLLDLLGCSWVRSWHVGCAPGTLEDISESCNTRAWRGERSIL